MTRITALLLIAALALALALGFVEAFGDEALTAEDLKAIEQMRAARSVDPNFVGDEGFYFGYSDHNGECQVERHMSFYYAFPPPLDQLRGVTVTIMFHRVPHAGVVPTHCSAQGPNYVATRYFLPSSCLTTHGEFIKVEPERCGITAWAPVQEEPPIPTPPCTPFGCFPLLPPNGLIEDPFAL